jgi:hypothetical protein
MDDIVHEAQQSEHCANSAKSQIKQIVSHHIKVFGSIKDWFV